MAFAKRSRLRKPRLRTFTVLIRLLMPSAGPVGGAEDNRVDDAPEVFPDHPSGLHDRLQTAARGPVQPPVPSGQRPGPAPIVPEVRGRFLQLPGPERRPASSSRPCNLLRVRRSRKTARRFPPVPQQYRWPPSSPSCCAWSGPQGHPVPLAARQPPLAESVGSAVHLLRASLSQAALTPPRCCESPPARPTTTGEEPFSRGTLTDAQVADHHGLITFSGGSGQKPTLCCTSPVSAVKTVTWHRVVS